jgi:SAM-dependent methyltransferase
MSEVGRAGEFWDREIAAPTHVSWMDDPLILQSIYEMIGGAATPMSAGDWFCKRFEGQTFERGLSIGCGVGNLEREAIRRGVCRKMDAFDGSIHSLRVAQRAAEGDGYSDRIRYFASDFNEPVLPRNTYDIVFFNQSLHHVANLEQLFRAVLQAMKPGALLYLDEYIGPSRTQWSDALIAPHRAAFAALPAETRKSDVLPLPIQPDDPSEAIRSGEIMEKLRVGFRVEEFRPYGGNLLAVLYPLLDWPRVPAELKSRLVAQDREMAQRGSYYAVIVARPARGLRKLYALRKYSAIASRLP